MKCHELVHVNLTDECDILGQSFVISHYSLIGQLSSELLVGLVGGIRIAPSGGSFRLVEPGVGVPISLAGNDLGTKSSSSSKCISPPNEGGFALLVFGFRVSGAGAVFAGGVVSKGAGEAVGVHARPVGMYLMFRGVE